MRCSEALPFQTANGALAEHWQMESALWTALLCLRTWSREVASCWTVDNVCRRQIWRGSGRWLSWPRPCSPKPLIRSKWEANRMLAQGADYEARGLANKAIEAYTSALKSGSQGAAVHLNLGLLYRDRRDYEHAVEHLSQALPEPDYTLGARFALGECYYAWGKAGDALAHLLEALRTVDSQVVQETDIEELNAAYKQFGQRYSGRDSKEEAHRFIQSVFSFFGGRSGASRWCGSGSNWTVLPEVAC